MPPTDRLLLIMFYFLGRSEAWNRLPVVLFSRIRGSLFHSSTSCRLNRILFDESEVEFFDGSPTVLLPRDDYRTIHVAKILARSTGETIRSGIVSGDRYPNGVLTDNAAIQWIPDDKGKNYSNRKKMTHPPGSLRIHLESLLSPSFHDLPAPKVSLILALPRPLQLGRMIPMIAQMGVDQLVLTTAKKVPRDYFGSHLFSEPHALTERLIEGLSQSGDVRLPRVHLVSHNFPRFLRETCPTLFPPADHTLVFAHVQRKGAPPLPRLTNATTTSSRLVVAVGPEGGWEEPTEVDLLQEAGFQAVTMGKRVLRSDCAVISLLALAQDALCDVDD